MLSLDQLLERLEKVRGGVGRTRRWVGDVPEARRTTVAAAVAREVGYAPPEGALLPISRVQAGLGLSFLGASELASTSPNRPREGLVTLARQAFSDLAGGAEFFSNGDWGEAWRTPRFAFRNISDSRIDGGVLGYDAHKAFIFWVEED